MKHLTSILLSICFAFSLIAEELPRVAVITFKASGTSEAEAIAASDKFSAELSKTKQYNVLDRANIAALMQELEFTNSDMADQSTALKMGKMLGAENIVFGTVAKMGDLYTVSVKEIEVETTRIVKAEMGESDKGFKKILKKAIPAMVESMTAPTE